jgi:VanZ family protein
VQGEVSFVGCDVSPPEKFQFLMSNQAVLSANEAPQRDAIGWLPVVLWGVVIFLLSTSTFSSINTSQIIDPILRWLVPTLSPVAVSVAQALIRKSAHFTEYGVLFWLLVRGPMRNRPYWAFALCVAYAALDETHQIFVPGRTPSIYDVALDSTGALFSNFLLAAIAELA